MLNIVILSYNGGPRLRKCVESVVRQGYEVTVLDNGSDPPVIKDELIKDVVRLPQNVGHIEGQNAVMRMSKGEWILFISDDVAMWGKSISNLVDTANNLMGWGIRWAQIMPKIIQPSGKIDTYGLLWRWPGYGMSIKSKESFRVPIVPSICYVMNKQAWEDVGGFDPSLLHSHEDVDFGLATRKKGYKNYLCKKACVTHIGNATLQYSRSDSWEKFHIPRMKVLRKHYTGLDYYLRASLVMTLDASARAAFIWSILCQMRD